MVQHTFNGTTVNIMLRPDGEERSWLQYAMDMRDSWARCHARAVITGGNQYLSTDYILATFHYWDGVVSGDIKGY